MLVDLCDEPLIHDKQGPSFQRCIARSRHDLVLAKLRLAWPSASAASYLKNDSTSRNAAKPTPSTYGSRAVKMS